MAKPITRGHITFWGLLGVTTSFVVLLSLRAGNFSFWATIILVVLSDAGAAMLYFFCFVEDEVSYKTRWKPALWFVLLMAAGLSFDAWALRAAPEADRARTTRQQIADSYAQHWRDQGYVLHEQSLEGNCKGSWCNNGGKLHLGNDHCSADFDLIYDEDHQRVMVVVSVTVDGEERLQDLTDDQVRIRQEQVCPKGA